MEQLESNPSVLRRKDSPNELPFPITDELLKLPGYRPKLRPVAPPQLPPKQRQRRHSDTVVAVTETLDSDKQENLEQALNIRPSVTNALYDARYVILD